MAAVVFGHYGLPTICIEVLLCNLCTDGLA